MARRRRNDVDERIEQTNTAHLVTVSCDGCGETVSVDEETALARDRTGLTIHCEACE